MENYLEGWTDRSQTEIPKLKQHGFAEDIIIRQYKPPKVRKKKAAAVPQENYTGEEPTVLVNQQKRESAFLKRRKSDETVEITKETFVIGKSAEADYVIRDNPTVSRRHVRISRREDGYWLEDLNSANHSYIDEKKMEGELLLQDGMVFRLSNDEEFEFIIRME